MFDKIFEGHFASVTDTHTATDPWKMGISVEVLRNDHPDWVLWQKENNANAGGLMATITKTATRSAVRVMMVQGAKGFRAAPKKTKAQEAQAEAAADQGDDGEEQQDALTRKVVDKVLDDMSDEQLEALVQTDVNAIKPGVALVLLKSWSGVVEPGNIAIECTLHNRLRFLGWDGMLAEKDGEAPKFFSREQVAKLDGGQISSAFTVTEFTGNPRKADGSLWVCPAGMKFGGVGVPVGDAITMWLLDASAAGSLNRAATLETSADFLADTPPGTPNTSGENQLPS